MKKIIILTMTLLLSFLIGVFSANVEMARAANIDPDYIDGDIGSQTITIYPTGMDLTAFGSNTAVATNKLIDANAHFATSGVTTGMYVSNATDSMPNPSAVITNVDSETQLTLSANIFTGINKLYGISSLFTTPAPNYAVTRDCRNVRWALSNIATNGTLILKAVDRYGNPHPFHFGTTFGSNKGGSAYMIKPVTVRGETGTTITGGYYALNVGASTFPINGDVTIENIRFDKNGGSALIVLNTNAGSSCYIKNNEFTNNFWETFNQYPVKPSWTDLVARSKLMYTAGWNVWTHYQLTVGVTTIPHGVKGNVIIEGNYFNPEVNMPPDLAPSTPDNPPWWVVFSIYSNGTACTCQYIVSNNTIINPSNRGINFMDVMGLSIAKGNYIEMGPLNAYLTLPPGPDADPNIPIWTYGELATAISAFYDFLELTPRSACPGRDISIGGDVILEDNTIICKGFDQAAIRVSGNTQSWPPYPPVWTPITPYRTFNSLSITSNSITLTDGRSGISVADVGPTPSQPLQSTFSPAMVMHNKIEGSALWGLVIGSTHFAAPRDTDDNFFFANRLSSLQIYTPSEVDYQWWVPSSQNAAHVIMYPDTHDNVFVGFSGEDLVDMGTRNKITGNPRSVKGGVGGTVSEVMPYSWSDAVSLQEIETE